MTTMDKPKGLDVQPERDKRSRLDLLEVEARLITQRDGWKEIAEAMLITAFGHEMKGLHATPPVELLEAVRGRGEAEVIAALRDGMIGRAWRVAGPDGAGTCDYPLCPHRGATPHPLLARVELRRRDRGVAAVLKVCAYDKGMPDETTPIGECHAWATWVARRVRNGRIEVTRGIPDDETSW